MRDLADPPGGSTRSGPTTPSQASDAAEVTDQAGLGLPRLVDMRTGLALGALAAGLAACFVAAVAVGSVFIPVGDVVAALTGGEVDREVWRAIIVEIRLPRAITGLLAGAALGVAGLQMQTLFRNPLADPFILGITSGASLGVALVVLAAGAAGSTFLAGLGFLGHLGVAGAAGVGAGAVMVAVLAISRRVNSVATLLIVGLMIGYATTAVVSLLIFSGTADGSRLRAFLTWSFGSFRGTTWRELAVFVPLACLALSVSAPLVKALNALLLGEGYAASMGVDVRRARTMVIMTASSLAGVVTAFAGPIAFVGIAVPHLARGLLGHSDHRVLLPAVVLLGGIVALVADIVAQLPGSARILPLNAVTSLLGAPVVVAVLLRRHRTDQGAVT